MNFEVHLDYCIRCRLQYRLNIYKKRKVGWLAPLLLFLKNSGPSGTICPAVQVIYLDYNHLLLEFRWYCPIFTDPLVTAQQLWPSSQHREGRRQDVYLRQQKKDF